MKSEKNFFNMEKKRHVIDETAVELPVSYFDASNLIGIFFVEPSRVNLALRGTGLSPVIQDGKAALALSFFEYRKCDLSFYNEVGLAAVVVPEGIKPPKNLYADLIRSNQNRVSSGYVLDLPVTTDEACAIGKKFWGYPKFVADISFISTGNYFQSIIKEKNSSDYIIRFSGSTGFRFPFVRMGFSTLSFLNGSVLKTSIDVRTPYKISLGNSLELSLGNSKHAMADRLRSLGLGLDYKRPSFVLVNDKFQSLLYEGKKNT
ncbi:MAG: acetoacetate decarboxylase family protein [Leptospiraceae bacterium]|nr:acetoacetate decarboxylase family protein [Leptospiraceae bacterium]